MKRITPLLFLVCSLLARTPGSNHYSAGLVLGLHARYGYTDFGEGRREYQEKNNLNTIGITVGRSFALPLRLRLMLPLLLETGTVREDFFENVPLNNGTSPDLVLSSRMYHGGVMPEVQFPFRLHRGVWAWVGTGFGGHYTAFIEQLKPDDGQDLIIEDDYLERSTTFTGSGVISAGFDFTIPSQMILSVRYLCRFWRPVQRKTRRDLYPLEAISYSERFFSHSLTFMVMIPRKW